ncbi:hypothetical protein, variant [Blastomyces dermatitidis ATCC 18188]|uniref:Uncharacterized protein n=1 Tax=Ajellomyces dermatitidis (strain ATCC 18188 / CBS 674.68) TaxID=653446 RepID=F2TRQ2_AJEDA|nr:hypothetical protein BDDG_08860 [Blastomyces dermatitidis ATCC 18188]KMW68784.1 hypothetical protein, variant [Blastomyces dermatitidis ATCC 18188]
MLPTSWQTPRQQGIYVVVYRGRYYVQKISANSDGAYSPDILCTIPANKVEYIIWLKERRQEYAAKEKLLEDFVFTLDSSQPRGAEYVKWKLREVGLYLLPSPLPPKRCGNYSALFTVDLDMQVVSFGRTIHLSLTNFPKDRDKFFAAPSAPSFRWPCLPIAAHYLIPFPSTVPVALECDLGKYETQYRTIPLSPSRWLSTDLDSFCPFHDLAFSKFKRVYSQLISQEYTRWSPLNFMFRELGYAIISFASGRVYFRIGESTDHYPVNEASWPSELAFGYHLARHLPGSAPEETIYWFDNVLVSLVPEVPQQRHIYVDKTVSFGLQQGKLAFQAILLSLSTVILIDVEDVYGIPVVKYTEPLELFENCKGPAISSPESPIHTSLGKLQISPPLLKSKESFRALSNFFTTATLRRLKPHGPETQGRLPNELYYMILDYTDNTTFLTCARVSYLFRIYCLSKIRLCEKNRNNNRDSDIYDTSSPIDTYSYQITQISSPLCLTVQNRASGEYIKWCPSKKSPPSWSPEPENELCLVPMFGEPNRLSESQQALNIFWKADDS